VDALGFRARQELAQSAKSFRMGMADGDGLTLFLGVAESELQLLANSGDLLDIIQERNIAESTGNAGVLRGVIGNRGGGSAAVNEEQVTLTKNDHEIRHQGPIGGGQGTLMVVDTDGVGDILQHAAHGLRDLRRGHSGVELLRFGHFVTERLHGQMQHDLVTAAVCFFRDLAGIGVIGQEGKSERVRKGEDGIGNGTIGAEIVENDGETRGCGAGGGRRMRGGTFSGRIARFGTEIASRFGIVAGGEASK